MKNSEEDQDQENDNSETPLVQKSPVGTLFQYFQKKAHPVSPSTLDVKCDEAPKDPIGSAQGSENQTNDTLKESKVGHLENCDPSCGDSTGVKDGAQMQKCQKRSSGKKKKQVISTDMSHSANGKIKEANLDVNKTKKRKGCGTNSNLSHNAQKPPQNPFQILMESGKKKGIWDKPTGKAQTWEDKSSEGECIEVENEVHDTSAEQQPVDAKYFSIFSKQPKKSSADMNLSSSAKTEEATKDVLSKPSTTKSKLSKNKSSFEGSKSSKRRKPSGSKAEENRKTESKKTRDCELLDDKKAAREKIINETDEVAMKMDPLATPRKRKSRLKVASDSDFEPENVQSGKRKDRTPSKSQNSSSKRPRTSSSSRVDAHSSPKPSSKPATLSAAQKLVKKSKSQKSSSNDSFRRELAPSGKPGTKQTLLTAGRKDDNDQPPAAGGQSNSVSPRRRSGRVRPERRAQQSDSELEFTPGRKSKTRRKETGGDDVEKTPGKRSEWKRSRARQTVEASGSEVEATPVKKPTKRASTGGRKRQNSGADIEVLSTKKNSRHSSGDVVEISPAKRPERRSSRPHRPMILSESETEPSPVKRPSRQARAARNSTRPATPTDSDPETTPVKKPLRRSSRPSRPVRRLSDSEVELSPLKKPARAGGRRSTAGDDPEVVLVRSRSAGTGPASARTSRAGVDAFQMLRRGGRPPKQTAAEKAATEARRAFLASGVPESLQVQADVARRLEESLTPLFPEVSHVQQRVCDEAAPPPETRPLPAGLSWIAEPPPLSLARPATSGRLVPDLTSRLGKVTGSDGEVTDQAVDVGAGGDSGGAVSDAAPVKSVTSPAEATDAGEPASSAAIPAPFPESSTARLPPLSLPECADFLRQLLANDREFSATISTTTTATSTPTATAPAGPALWTDRFRPRHHGSFMGGCLPAEELHQWLADWRPPSVWDDDDGSEEPAGDGTVLLLGPTGCGKTSAVYAAAAQLGFQVLEVSTSVRRSGRHLSSQLSEATQSQRVSLPGGVSAAEPPSRSLLLFEDVQLVSEELDDGFLAAAGSLVAAAKRPVVLTSSDPAVTRTRLLRGLPHRLLAAAAPSAAALRSYLALVALTRGWLLPEAAAVRLSEGRDPRKALLQLQWLCEGQGEGQTVDTWQALTEAQLEAVEEFLDVLPAVLKVVTMEDGQSDRAEVPELQTDQVGRRESLWQPPVPETTAGYDGQTRRRWRCVDPDLFSDDDDRPAPAPDPTPEPAAGGAASEPAPPEERALLSASVAALAGLYDVRSACDALVSPAERCVMGSWWQRRPEADMAEAEQPRCVTEERGQLLGRQLAREALRAASSCCRGQLRAARAGFSSSGRPEPSGLRVPLYDDEGVREAAWEEASRLSPAVPSLLLSRRAATADLLPSIRRICRLECRRRATDGGRTRRFLHYLDQMGLHAIPTGLRTHICKSLM